MPLLSIIIPVYNVENYLEECLNSILNQHFNDYEVILVDDVSTDRSGDICDEYGKKYSNFKVIHLKSKALPSGARNIGLENATGEYVHFCDSDDYYLKDVFSSISQNIKENLPDVLVGEFICKPEKGAFFCSNLGSNSNMNRSRNSDDIIKYFLNLSQVPWATCIFIIRRQFLINNNIYFLEKCYFEDAEWFTKILCNCNKFLFFKEPFYCYRPRKIGSITSIKTFSYSKSHLLLSLKLLEFLRKKNYRGIRKDYIISRVKFLLGLFATRCDTFNKNQIQELAQIIDNNIESFEILEDISEIGDLFNLVSRYGSYMGLCLYKTYVVEKTLEKVQGMEYKDIYIFPTGYNGEGTARILKKSGYKVKAFLDNSETKNGAIIDELSVKLPKVIKELSSEQLENIFVLITTQKKDVVEILKKQLIGLGLKDYQFDNIIY